MSVRGAVNPTPTSAAVLRPIAAGDLALRGGFWGDWQEANASASIPHALQWLHREGVTANLGPRAGNKARRGPCYTDSDLYKTMEAMAWEVARSDDLGIRVELDRLTQVVAGAQNPDGYINSYVQAGLAERWADLADGHELYCLGHLIQAGIAHRRATGEESLFRVASRAADLVVKEFGPGGRDGIDGHEEIEIALVELYRETGTRAYLDLAVEFVSRRGHRTIASRKGHGSAYYQDAVPALEQRDAEGHAVRATYLLTALADIALETGDSRYLDAARNQWEAIAASKSYITGALGSRFEDESFGEPFELPPDRAYGETCASVGHMMASWRLLLATGDARYADAIERSMYNVLAGSTDSDRTGFFYANPLQRRRALEAADPRSSRRRADAPGARPPWFETACCPPNVMRTLATVHQWIATHDGGGVQIHQYMPSTIDARQTALGARLDVTTDYPTTGTVSIAVSESRNQEAGLAIRVPQWAHRFELTVNGLPAPMSEVRGYVRIVRRWRSGDVIELSLPVRPRLTCAHPAVDALRGTAVIERGPEVYCLESVDQLPDLDLAMVTIAPDAVLLESIEQVAGEVSTVVEVLGLAVDASAWIRPWAELATLNPDARPVLLRAIPYRLWANRGPSTMRVHIPIGVLRSVSGRNREAATRDVATRS